MQKREMSAVIFSSISLLCFGLSACVSEKNQQDFRQEQVNEQIAKIMPIKGTYNGTIVSAVDNAPLGNVSLTLTPDTSLQTSADNLSSEQHAIVRGVISYTGMSAANVQFNQGFYDPNSGVFQVSFSIVDSAPVPVTHQIELSGNISGNNFSGTLQVEGFAGYGGNVTLTKGAPLVQANVSTSLLSSRAILHDHRES